MTTKPRQRKPNGKSICNKAESMVADRILELLDKGELPPWSRPWRVSLNGVPRNAISQRPYRGINVWLTLLSQEVCGYDDHRWLTYRQAQKAGGNVKKGEKATQIVFWKMIVKEDPESGEERTFPLSAAYNVFNVDQTEGCTLPELPVLPEPPDPIEQAEAIIAGMPNPPRFETYESGNLPPRYVPAEDLVKVPDARRFDQMEHYYNTIYHELTHATGHPDRLNRFDVGAERDLHAYGLEELVAGMGSAMLADMAGIGHATIEADASYVKTWADTIRANRGIIIAAAQKSQKAVDYIVGAETRQAAPEHRPGSPQTPDFPDVTPLPGFTGLQQVSNAEKGVSSRV